MDFFFDGMLKNLNSGGTKSVQVAMEMAGEELRLKTEKRKEQEETEQKITFSRKGWAKKQEEYENRISDMQNQLNRMKQKHKEFKRQLAAKDQVIATLREENKRLTNKVIMTSSGISPTTSAEWNPDVISPSDAKGKTSAFSSERNKKEFTNSQNSIRTSNINNSTTDSSKRLFQTTSNTLGVNPISPSPSPRSSLVSSHPKLLTNQDNSNRNNNDSQDDEPLVLRDERDSYYQKKTKAALRKFLSSPTPEYRNSVKEGARLRSRSSSVGSIDVPSLFPPISSIVNHHGRSYPVTKEMSRSEGSLKSPKPKFSPQE